MAYVEGLTKVRMLEIEAASVVDGEVVGDNLHLTRHDGTTIDAGSVRGPAAPNLADASTTVKGIVELATPAEVADGTSDILAVTPLGLGVALDKKQNLLPEALVSGENLNDRIVSGVFGTNSNSIAASLSNAPEPYAGILEVFQYPTGALVSQRYTVYATQGDRVWVRGMSTSLTWNPWKLLAFNLVRLATTNISTVSPYGQPVVTGPRENAQLRVTAEGRWQLRGMLVNTVAATNWTINVQYVMGSVPAAARPQFDIVSLGAVNIPGVGVDMAHFVVRGTTAGSPFSGSAGNIIFQPFSTRSLSIPVGTLGYELPILEWD